MKEKFKPLRIKKQETNYMVSNKGNIYSKHSNKILKKIKDKDGYEIVCLSINGKIKNYKVHRLVCKTFKILKGVKKNQVNHIDGVKDNNNSYNLEWCDASDNQIHACKMNLVTHRKGMSNSSCKYDDETIHKVCEMMLKGYSNIDIRDALGLPIKYLGKIRRKEIRIDIINEYF